MGVLSCAMLPVQMPCHTKIKLFRGSLDL